MQAADRGFGRATSPCGCRMKTLLCRCCSMRAALRAVGWLAFAAVLFGVGWTIYQVLPPRPRWMVEGKIDLQEMLPDSSAAVLTKRGGGPLIVRDVATGAVQASVASPGRLGFTRDLGRWLWWPEESVLAGFDVRTGKEWRTPLPDERNLRSTELSEDGELAVLCADHFVYVIDMQDG